MPRLKSGKIKDDFVESIMELESFIIHYPSHYLECEGCRAIAPLLDKVRKKLEQSQSGVPYTTPSITVKCRITVPQSSLFDVSAEVFAQDALTKLNTYEKVFSEVICPGCVNQIKKERNVRRGIED